MNKLMHRIMIIDNNDALYPKGIKKVNLNVLTTEKN